MFAIRVMVRDLRWSNGQSRVNLWLAVVCTLAPLSSDTYYMTLTDDPYDPSVICSVHNQRMTPFLSVKLYFYVAIGSTGN